MQNFELTFYENADELASATADAWLNEVELANQELKKHSVALSGGRIATSLFSAITQQAKARGVSLARVHFFWADERCVPPDDSESNFKMAHELLFAPLRIPAIQIHRIHGEDTPDSAAKKAADELTHIAPPNSDDQPILDLIFLGIGPDGHTASLFPGEPESVKAGREIYRVIRNSPKPPPSRITLGYPAISAAQQVWVLVSGGGKEQAFAQSLEPDAKTPFSRVLRQRLNTKIFSDVKLK